MGAKLSTQVTQLSIVAGTQKESATNTGLVETSSRVSAGAGKGNLYLLVDVTGDRSGKEEIHRELIQILSEEYFRVPGGVVNGLRQAIRAANTYLYETNTESLPLWRRLGEVSCAVLRGNDLYTASAGAAVVCVLHRGRLRIFPPPSSQHRTLARVDEPPVLPSLGAETYLPQVGVSHCYIEADDLILVASSALMQLATRQQIVEAAESGPEGLSRTLISLASHSDLSTLLIHTTTAQTDQMAHRQGRVAAGRGIASGVRWLPVPRVGKAVKGIPARTVVSGLGRPIAALWALILGSCAGLARGTRSFFTWLISSGILATIGRMVSAGCAALLQGLGTLSKRMLPEPGVAHQPMETTYVRSVRKVGAGRSKAFLPLLGALSIVGVLALIATGLVIQSHSRAVHFSQVLGEAQGEIDLARASYAPSVAREHFGKAQEAVEQALQMRPSDAEAVTLQEEIHLGLDEIDRVVRLEFSAQMPFVGPDDQPSRMVLHDKDVYVLDEGTQQLYSYVLDNLEGFQQPAGGAVLLGPESSPGDVAVQELNDLVWMESGSGRENSNVLLLINGLSLVQLDGLREFTSVSVADSDLWGDPRAIGAYSGYLYVLDAEQDRILKYLPTGSSYDSSPTDYLQHDTSVDLSESVDMAIDGHIYVLLRDGTILRFLGGQQEPFSISGLSDQDLQDPTAIFAYPEAEYIYVVDAGNQRIVQLDKEGAFVRQFRPARQEGELFQSLRDVVVNEATGQLLILNSNALILSSIPELPHVEQ